MLVKYYQRTNEFDEKLPIFSISFLYYGLIMHIIMAWALFTDDTILPGYETVVNYTGYERKEYTWFDKSVNFFIKSTNKGHSRMYLYGLIVIFFLFIIGRLVLQK